VAEFETITSEATDGVAWATLRRPDAPTPVAAAINGLG